MLFSIAVTLLFLSFFASVVFTGYFRNLARSNKFLIDIPDKSRKFHFRPTPLIGGLSIHGSMLLSTLFLLFLVDYKYDFQFDALSNINLTEIQTPSPVGYSKKLSIKKENMDKTENFRLNITQHAGNNNELETYDVNFGSIADKSINISKVSDDVFNVTLPSGEIKTYKAENSGIVEINLSGEKISEQFIIEENSSEFFTLSSFTAAFIIIALLLQAFILIDDAYGIGAGKRLFIQCTGTLSLIFLGEVYIENLNVSLLGINLELGLWGIPFTVFAVVGIINAFNMIDGINGLCSGFALIALGALQVASGFDVANYSLVIAMGSIIGFLFYNLGFLGTKRRVFLGDNGSTFLGFFVAWTCINYSQSSNDLIKPVTCLWLVAIPLLDCLGVMTGRIIKGILPFSPGRDHIHHKLQLLTQSSSRTLLGLLILGLLLAGIGVMLDKSYLSSEISLILFIAFAVIYYIGSGKLFRTKKNILGL
ncbi:undecaprenyl/decaprenyl-phosphate alpha-N-acetylglucosaminyl 1-phosphate transferase [Pseudomonadota bacterium]|nr:undecaprenyl/decaprenyl-phosphate alpha-N-acetylglucosaminyl 1-phosphate transferase [Pseudomonadota bacterium]